MKVDWQKTAQTQEEITVASYIENKTHQLQELLNLYKEENFLTLSFTPPPLKSNYYTYEIRYHHHDKKYLINVWKGIRTGDAMPVLYGYLDD